MQQSSHTHVEDFISQSVTLTSQYRAPVELNRIESTKSLIHINRTLYCSFKNRILYTLHVWMDSYLSY
jgi:hypothetical protein